MGMRRQITFQAGTFSRGAGVASGFRSWTRTAPRARAAVSHRGTRARPVRRAPLFSPMGPGWKIGCPRRRARNSTPLQPFPPLHAIRQHVTVLSGLDSRSAGRAMGTMPRQPTSSPGCTFVRRPGKIELRWRFGRSSGGGRIGHLTPLPSLELATDPVIDGLDRAVNYTRMYGSFISWLRPNVPAPADHRSPGPSSTCSAARHRRPALAAAAHAADQSLLDAALADAPT